MGSLLLLRNQVEETFQALDGKKINTTKNIEIKNANKNNSKSSERKQVLVWKYDS